MQNLHGIHNASPGALESYRGRTDPEAIKAVAKEMEAMFTYELIKVMRETTDTASKAGLGTGTYTTMFDMELSKLFAERGIGLQEALSRGVSSAVQKQEQPSPANSGAEPLQERDWVNGVREILPDIHNPGISSGYGPRKDPFSGERKFHHGVDIPAAEGADIHAVRKGTVTFSGEQKGYGNVVIIDHGDGFMTKYAHNQVNLVKEGDPVDAGLIIAKAGATGRSTGTHVHFEVLYQGRDVSPGLLLARRED